MIIPALDGDVEEQTPPEDDEIVGAVDELEEENFPDMTVGL